MKNLFTFALAAAIFSACSTPKKLADDPETNLLLNWMTGHFTSESQAAADTNFFNITLRMQPIWQEDRPNNWLYVEQAMTSKPDKPYRQRVYKVEKMPDGSFQSIVYTLPDPSKVVGWWANPSNFSALKPADLSLREGCSVFLKRESEHTFKGSTNGTGCESNLRGAKYASSKVSISKRGIVSWDQGFNEKGEQVWGATSGGYDFVKQKK